MCNAAAGDRGAACVCVLEGDAGGVRRLSPAIKVRPPGAAASQKPFIVITKTAVTLA